MFFWKKRKEKVEVFSPLTGRLLSLEEVPDQVFSRKMMGEGFAIEPAKGEVLAPVNGEVIHVFPTKHAIGLKTASNLELLIHIGIDTVELGGKGFEVFISEGDSVKVGQKLLQFDMDLIKEQGKSLITPVVFPQSADWEFDLKAGKDLHAGESLVATADKK
ncbi:MAG: PTS glucose transporter subunit IIA [Thermoactinomyces sp.]